MTFAAIDPALRLAEKQAPNPETGCLEFQGYRCPKGYGQFKLHGRMEKAHRAAWIIARGEMPPGLHVLHACDNPSCVNVDHLFPGTNDDNVADRVSKGRSARGRPPQTTKLTAEDVREIRRLSASGMSSCDIARRFPVNDRSVSNIVTGKTWRSVQ